VFDVYVTNNATDTTEPNAKHHVWHKQIAFDEDFTILKNDAKLIPSGAYFIGVEALDSYSTYMITVSTDNTAVVLFDQQRKIDNITEAHRYRYYEHEVTSARNLSVAVFQCRGDTNLVVSSTTHYPTADNADYIVTDSDKIQFIFIPKQQSHVIWYIGVLSMDEDVEFEVCRILSFSRYTLAASGKFDKYSLVLTNSN
jgi:hypothetical protein